MQIQWFPGHMNKARNEIKAIIPKVDLLIEVLDARIPYSSENPMLRELRGNTPVFKILAKSDLADPNQTKQWIEWHENKSGVRAHSVSTSKVSRIRTLPSLFYGSLPDEQREKQSMTAMIAGVPNVGKSTLINILAGRTVAKTGNEPAVTKGQQRIQIGNGVTLIDTPGMLWPNVVNPKSGLRLAAVGSVKDTAMEYEDVAAFIVEFMIKHYPGELANAFDFDSPPTDVIEFLDDLGQRRGCLGRSGVVDYERVSKIVVNEFRQGKLGTITLETPAAIEIEIAELSVALAVKQQSKNAMNKQRKEKFKARNTAKQKKPRH